ncbi:MAG: PilZ domain-containing protein [Oscillospiraceae bacterium]|nr:PilZ domain-containing protein [Oscillospiraceae bacterium]
MPMTNFLKRRKVSASAPIIDENVASEPVKIEPETIPANRREYVRVSADLHATLRLNEVKHDAKIIDISAGGVKLSTSQLLTVGEIVPTELMLTTSGESGASVVSASGNSHTERVIVLCKIVRAVTDEASTNTYGAKFESLNEINLKKIRAYVLDSQVAARLSQ